MLHMHTYMHNKSKKLYVVSVRVDRKGGTQAEAVLALTIPAPVHAHKPSPSPSDLWSDTAKLEHLHYSHLLEGTVVVLHPNGLQPAAREEHAQLTGGLPATILCISAGWDVGSCGGTSGPAHVLTSIQGDWWRACRQLVSFGREEGKTLEGPD